MKPNVCPCCEQVAPLAAWDGYCAACDEAHCPCGEGEFCCITGSITGPMGCGMSALDEAIASAQAILARALIPTEPSGGEGA